MPAKDAKVARKTASNVLSGGLSATEAIARGFGLKSHAERRAESAGQDAPQLPAGDAAEEAERQLAAGIAEAEVCEATTSAFAEFPIPHLNLSGFISIGHETHRTPQTSLVFPSLYRTMPFLLQNRG